MIATSVVEFKAGALESVKREIEKFEEIELYGHEESRALIVFDTDEEKRVEELCAILNECPDIVTVAHHSFYFGGGGDIKGMPPVSELFKKKS